MGFREVFLHARLVQVLLLALLLRDVRIRAGWCWSSHMPAAAGRSCCCSKCHRRHYCICSEDEEIREIPNVAKSKQLISKRHCENERETIAMRRKASGVNERHT